MDENVLGAVGAVRPDANAGGKRIGCAYVKRLTKAKKNTPPLTHPHD